MRLLWSRYSWLIAAALIRITVSLFNKESPLEQDFLFYDRPFWRDVPTHLHPDRLLDIERISTFHQANSALRRTEYNKERCENSDSQNFKNLRIVQIYIEAGIPFEVPCYSCLRNQTGFTTVFYLIPSRNFLADIEMHERREAFGDEDDVAVPIATWLLHQIKNHQKSDDFKYEAQFVFGIGRAAGGHTPKEMQPILGDDTGRLQINVVNNSFVINLHRSSTEGERHLVYEKFYGGITLICAQLVDNEPRSLGFIYNIDYLLNINSGDEYVGTYKNLSLYELFNTSSSNLPFMSKQINIKIDISWEQWSCCSACCCSVALCGLYSNEKKCHEMDSYRSRRGFLSIYLLDHQKKLNIRDKVVSEELGKILRVSPYRERGIAIFSSFIFRNPRFKEHLWERTLKEIFQWNFQLWIGVPIDDYKGVGMFIQEQDCTGMEQKTNCSVLAACRGQLLEENPPPVEELIPVDPCGDLPMVTLSISESSSSFRFEPNISYRLRLDGLNMETMKSVTWKIGGATVLAYDLNKPCHEQGVAVHANGFDLIVIDVNATNVLDRVIEAFTGKHRFRIHFLEDRQEYSSFTDQRDKLIIAGIIGGCASLVLAVVTIIHNYVWRQIPPLGTEKSRRITERTTRQTKRALRKRRKEKALASAKEKANMVAG